MVIMGKRKGRATQASALMESIRQSVGSASSSSHPNPMPAETVPPGAPPLIVRRPTVDSCSTGSQSASVTAPETATAPESARRIVDSARIKVRSPTGKCINLLPPSKLLLGVSKLLLGISKLILGVSKLIMGVSKLSVQYVSFIFMPLTHNIYPLVY